MYHIFLRVFSFLACIRRVEGSLMSPQSILNPVEPGQAYPIFAGPVLLSIYPESHPRPRHKRSRDKVLAGKCSTSESEVLKPFDQSFNRRCMVNRTSWR